MKNIKRNYFISILAVCLLVSFTPPLEKAKKVEVKPIDTYLSMGGGIIMPRPSALLVERGQGNSVSERSRGEQGEMPTITSGDSTAKVILPNVLATNEASTTFEQPNQPNFYKFDSTSHTFEKIEALSGSMKAVSFDPVSFKLSANKETINVGEEFEITITAKLLNVTPQMMFTFEGSNEFTIKLITPEGFVQTGGQVDFIRGKVTEKQPIIEYRIKGFFERPVVNNAFKLIRGHSEATNTDIFELKDTFTVPFNTNNISIAQVPIIENGRQQVVTTQTSACTIDASDNVAITVYNVTSPIISAIQPLLCDNPTTTLNASGCNGVVKWSNGSQGNSITISTPATYNATCDLNSCISTASNSLVIGSGNVPTVPQISTDYTTLCIYQGLGATLTATGCNGTIIWSTGATTNSIYVTTEGTYTAECSTICGLSNKSNPINITRTGTYPQTPSVATDFPYICANEKSKIQGVGCSGIIVWSTGEKGPFIYVGAGTYYAKCQNTCGISPNSSPINVVLKQPSECIGNNNARQSSMSQVTYSGVSSGGLQPKIQVEGARIDNSICGSKTLTLKALNCDGQQISWCDGSNIIGTTSTITVTPSATTTYYLKCSSGTPVLTSTKTLLCNSTETAILSTTSCPAGSNVVYYKKNGTIWDIFTTPSAASTGIYSAKCNATDGETLRSNTFTISPSTSTPTAPVLVVNKNTICGTESSTITATGCSESNIKWSNNETNTLAIAVNTSGTYTATCTEKCGTSTLTSPASNAIIVTYTQVCSCSTATITTNAPGNRINEHSDLTLSVPSIPNVTYYWSGPNIPLGVVRTSNTITIPNVSLANAGLYDVAMSCRTNNPSVSIGIDDIDECASSFDYFAYSTSPNGEVGVGDEVRFIADAGSDATYEWSGPAGFYSLQQFPKIPLATKANEGGYNVIITKTINGNTCSINESMIVKIGDCNFDAGPSFAEVGSNFNLSVWSNKNLVGATFEWLKLQGNGSWLTVSTIGNPTFAKTDANRGTYALKVSYKGCNVEKSINVAYVAAPVYEGYLDITTCDGISGWLRDNANTQISLTKQIVYKIDGDEYSFTLRNNEGDSYPRFNIPIPNKYKDGLPHTVLVYYPNSTTLMVNSINRNFQCCSLVFAGTPTVNCTSSTAGSLTVAAKSGLRGNYQFFLETQTKNEDGANIYSNYSTIWEQQGTDGSYTFTNVPNGTYRIKVREGANANACLITTNAAVNCQGTVDCIAPLVSIFPSDNFREGMGIIPKLYANANANPATSPSNIQGGLKLNGSGSVALPQYNYLNTNFSVEATIFPSPDGTIILGDASDASTQRYLFTSWSKGADAPADKAGFYLSVGANGINLIEQGDNFRRVAITYEGNISGWTHIAVVYKADIATLFVNGQPVGKSTITPYNNHVVGPNSLGTDRDKGFMGNIYATRIWASSLENQVVAQLKNNLDPVLAIEPNVGFWIFDKQPVNGSIEDLSQHKRKARLEGQAFMSLVETPIIAPNAPVFEWWLNGIKVGTGNTYTPPANRTNAGTYNYVVKYQRPNGSYCQSTKTLTITPAVYGALSGCYTMLSNADQRAVYPKYTPETGQYSIWKGNGASEKEIWRFEHLGNDIYRINSAFFTDMALAAPNSLPLTIKDKRITETAQQWKANVLNAATLTYSFAPQNNPTQRLGYFWGDTDPLVARPMTGADGILESFQLVPAACPLPAQDCNASGILSVERWLQPSLFTMNTGSNSPWANLNVPQFIAENPLRYSTEIPLTNFNITNTTANYYTKPPKPNASIWLDGRYLQRFKGYLCAPKNGDYMFFIKTDEFAQLWMSTDEDPTHKRLVVQSTGYSAGFYERTWEQAASVTLSKGRSYYFEVIMKDEINAMNVALAWIRPDEYVPQSNWNSLQAMPMSYISAVPRDITPRQLIVVADKTKAAPTENVMLTATGCDYGRVVWKAGTEVIQNATTSITTITRQGPGIYQALCTGDYNVVEDWITVKVDITTELLPIMGTPPPVCATGNATLTVSNPQAGLSIKWWWLKDDVTSQETFRQFNSSGNIFKTHPSIFNNALTQSITQPGPRTYWVQFFNTGGYETLPKAVIVEPYFVPNIKATNNSPIESGGTLTLSTGALTGATYAWTGPATETPPFGSVLRSPTRANFDANMVGVYTLKITAPSTAGSCNATYTTQVDIANCDIYIKATNPAAANAETYQLPRKTGVVGQFDPLTLKVEPLEGTANFSAYDVTWMLNGNPLQAGNGIGWVSGAEPTLTTNQIGEYVAVLSLKRNPATTCEAKVNINAIPCKTFNANLSCTLPVITAPTQLTAGIPLAAGDVFTAGDYKVTITEITSPNGCCGSPSGYNGKGYVEQMKLIRVGGVSGAEPTIAQKVAVTLENTVVNDCYELAGGKVVSAYDASWGGVLDVSVDEEDFCSYYKESFLKLGDKFKTVSCDNISETIDFSTLLKNKINIENNISINLKTLYQNYFSDIILNLNTIALCLKCNGGSNNSNCSQNIENIETILNEIEKSFLQNICNSNDDLGQESIEIYPYFISESSGSVNSNLNLRISSDDWQSLTSQLFLEHSVKAGVKNEIWNRWPDKTSKEKNDKFIERLGRIFEATALKSLGYNNTNGKDFSLTDKTIRNKDVKPDQIQGAGALIRLIAPPNPIPKETRWYKWEQSVFIEVKYTNRSEQNIPANINDNQILGYIDVLKNMDDGWYAKTTGFVIPTETSFVKKKINAANYGGATIHLVVPSGVTIDNLIYTTAANANVKVYLSFMQYRPVSNPFSSESFEYRVTKPECKNCTILKSGSKFLKLGVLPLGVVTYGQWQKN